jgi:FRG domain
MYNLSSPAGGPSVRPFMALQLQNTRLFEEDDDDLEDSDTDVDKRDDKVEDMGGVSNLQEFTSKLKDYFRLKRGAWVFRGHSSQSFKLIPKVGRTSHTSETRQQFELSIFNMFKRTALQHLQRSPTNDWEWLAIAQHHGLPTRLLDWS